MVAPAALRGRGEVPRQRCLTESQDRSLYQLSGDQRGLSGCAGEAFALYLYALNKIFYADIWRPHEAGRMMTNNVNRPGSRI